MHPFHKIMIVEYLDHYLLDIFTINFFYLFNDPLFIMVKIVQ